MDSNFYIDKAKEFLDRYKMSYPIFSDELDLNGDEIFAVETGASKIVLIPRDEEVPFVFKIPFLGTDCEAERQCRRSGICINYVNTSVPNFINCDECEYSFDEDSRDGFLNALSGFKELDDMEIFYSNPRAKDYDYCFAEESIYQMSLENNLNNFFLKIEFCDFYEDTPIYKQVRASQIGHYGSHSLVSEESRNAAAEIKRSFDTDTDFTALLIESYGFEAVEKLVEFCERFYVNDLHSGNIGFFGNLPILLDYSGFHD